MKKVVLRVSGITNENSSIQFEKQLKKCKNIETAYMDIKTGILTVQGNNHLTIEELEKNVESLGYDSLGVELNPLTKKPSLIRLILFGCILVILFYFLLAKTFHLPLLNIVERDTKKITLAVLAGIYFIWGFDILKEGVKSNLQGRSTLNTLASLSILSSLLYGYWYLFTTNNYNYTYLEVSMFLIYFMKIGQYLDKKNKRNMALEISQISNTKINKVNRKTNDSYEEVNREEVRKGDILLCLPGDRVLLDGVQKNGYSHFDESTITGESLPVEKRENSKILSGSINYENEIEYTVEEVLKDTTTSKIKKKVMEEENKIKRTSTRMDRVCNYIVPFLLIGLIIIGVIYFMITKNLLKTFDKIAILLMISSPFGFALTTPLSFQKNIKLAKNKKLLIKEMNTLEEARNIDTVVFDKTGTLTNGYLSISRINNHCDLSEKELLELLGSIEKHSTHAISRGITKYLRNEKISSNHDFIIEDLPGYGVKAKDDHDLYYACNGELLEKLDIINSYKEEERKLKLEGNYVLYLAKNTKVIATFGLKDIPKKETSKVINSLKERKLDIILLTGDDEITAKKIAKELEIEKVVAGMNPESKKEYIESLKKQGKKLIMVGDGINDAPALASSTIGIAIKNASDIPTSSSDVILTSSNLFRIVDLFILSKNMLQKVKWNIFISIIFSILSFITLWGMIPNVVLTPLLLISIMLINVLLVVANTLREKSK